MREADVAQFADMLDAVCSLLSRGTYAPSAANTALWFRALAGYAIEDVRAAFDAHVRDPQRGRFVPNPADIIVQLDALILARTFNEPMPGLTAQDRAAEAWAHLLRQARSVGAYGSPSIDSKSRIALDGIGGWNVLCRTDESQLQHLWRRFAEHFAAADGRERREAMLEYSKDPTALLTQPRHLAGRGAPALDARAAPASACPAPVPAHAIARST